MDTFQMVVTLTIASTVFSGIAVVMSVLAMRKAELAFEKTGTTSALEADKVTELEKELKFRSAQIATLEEEMSGVLPQLRNLTGAILSTSANVEEIQESMKTEEPAKKVRKKNGKRK